LLGLPDAASEIESKLRSEWSSAKVESKDYVVVVGNKKSDTIVKDYDETKDKLSLFKKFAYLQVELCCPITPPRKRLT